MATNLAGSSLSGGFVFKGNPFAPPSISIATIQIIPICHYVSVILDLQDSTYTT
jgi:hypothetical protein